MSVKVTTNAASTVQVRVGQQNAIKVVNLNGDMCGFIPKKYKINAFDYIFIYFAIF